MERMWINQPSTLQKYHYLHGTRVFSDSESNETCIVYFLNGDIISQQIDRSTLSAGWPDRG